MSERRSRQLLQSASYPPFERTDFAANFIAVLQTRDASRTWKPAAFRTVNSFVITIHTFPLQSQRTVFYLFIVRRVYERAKSSFMKNRVEAEFHAFKKLGRKLTFARRRISYTTRRTKSSLYNQKATPPPFPGRSVALRNNQLTN